VDRQRATLFVGIIASFWVWIAAVMGVWWERISSVWAPPGALGRDWPVTR